MPKSTVFLLLVITIVKCQSEQIIFESEELLEIGDACIAVYNGVRVNGVCQSIEKCSLIFTNVRNQTSADHIVCGYKGKTQIVCCPNTNYDAVQLRSVPKLNLRQNLECPIENSNETGFIKFLADCPELNTQEAGAHIGKLCTDDLCSNLVCCPATPLKRLKNVCWNVDHPFDTLQLKLLLNQECTVKGLNIKGRYQGKWYCGYAERNPNLLPMLENVCNDEEACKNWYCCPIENDDSFECTANQILSSTAILVGPKCIDSNTGRNGTCKRHSNCAHHDILTLDKCGTYCCRDFYCCPDELETTDQTIWSRECSSYVNYVSKEEIEVPMNLYINQTHCLYLMPAGGIIAVPGEFPHMAALGYKPNQEILWNCGGSLISNRYILTAGHCLSNPQMGPVQKVRLGAIDLLNDVNTADCPEDYDVARLIPHPEYTRRYVYNDIGLIELATEVKFNFHIRPICLPSSADIMQKYISMGWGATGPLADPSVKLIKVDQELFTYEECQNHYDVGRRHPNGIMNETHICAGSRDSIQSTCPGDSGGPLIVHHPVHSALFYIQGIVSFGAACGFRNSPGVYTKVFPYLKRIEETVWNN